LTSVGRTTHTREAILPFFDFFKTSLSLRHLIDDDDDDDDEALAMAVVTTFVLVET
jgi:hypothetical protein